MDFSTVGRTVRPTVDVVDHVLSAYRTSYSCRELAHLLLGMQCIMPGFGPPVTSRRYVKNVTAVVTYQPALLQYLDGICSVLPDSL